MTPTPLSPASEKIEVDSIAVEDVPHHSSSDDCSLALTVEEEKRLWRKVDMRLIPISVLLYLMSYLDRGNAKLEGLLTQLDLTGQRYNTALVRPFKLAGLLLKKLRPSRWLPGLTLAWGIVATCMGLVKNYPQLVAVRVCLGIAESGMSPGIYYLLSLWYPKHMLQWRFGLFWGGATCSGAFSGLIAYGISFMSGTDGLLGWSWIFIVEGLATVAVAILAIHNDRFAVFVDLPDTATFLTPKERTFLLDRLRSDYSGGGEEEKFDLREVPRAMLDWKIVVAAITDVTISMPLYGISVFLPFGFDTVTSQLLTVPPYVLATIVVLICSIYSDRMKLRSPFVFSGLVLALVGYGINVADVSIGVKYFGTYLVVVGAYLSAPMELTWIGNNCIGHYKRGIGLGMTVMFGNIGGVIASNVYRIQDAPRYTRGHIFEMAFIALGLVLVPLTALAYVQGNKRRDAAQHEREEKSLEVQYTEAELRKMGDRAPDFRYTL
ncbi:MFS general substrate transporter [Trametes versicolor FP-101664 SS1]|uniref:MFS general substrate transporter n=1 Tax=Trametes versicolor (strain FP-101664) TaxID=717944 RepID=R7S800_TRAVS|nr:MFS general substrate transporter [Trametes versicolor FP-101664 SS1]EIW52131.1 MFS general substrate transporter [Trametes versicolor FP-101664 SS1]